MNADASGRAYTQVARAEAQARTRTALLDAAETSTLEQQLELEARTQAELTRTADFREGVNAFVPKRAPVWSGS